MEYLTFLLADYADGVVISSHLILVCSIVDIDHCLRSIAILKASMDFAKTSGPPSIRGNAECDPGILSITTPTILLYLIVDLDHCLRSIAIIIASMHFKRRHEVSFYGNAEYYPGVLTITTPFHRNSP